MPSRNTTEFYLAMLVVGWLMERRIILAEELDGIEQATYDREFWELVSDATG